MELNVRLNGLVYVIVFLQYTQTILTVFNTAQETIQVVDDLKWQSGFKWDELSGADIRPESQAVWDDYIIVSSQIYCPLHHPNSYEEKSKSSSVLEKGWIHYQAIQTLLSTKPKGLNIFHPGQPMTQEENGDNDLPGGGFDDLSGGGTSEDTGCKNLHHSDEEEEEEEPISWVSQVIGLINHSSQVCLQEQTPPCETPL